MDMMKILVVDGRAEERRAIIDALCQVDGAGTSRVSPSPR
jgi:hypothetical protein